jgi:thiol-disulfide isomerase/thioredoxin
MNSAILPTTSRQPGSRRLLPAILILGLAAAPAARSATGDPDSSVRLAAVPADDHYGQAPEFPRGITWLNSPPRTLKQLRGKVVLIDFWEYTCVNCIRTFPYLKEWDRRYRDKGLVIVGVHTPEFDFAKLVPNVRKAVSDFGFKYPIAVDSDYKIWQSYGNRY